MNVEEKRDGGIDSQHPRTHESSRSRQSRGTGRFANAYTCTHANVHRVPARGLSIFERSAKVLLVVGERMSQTRVWPSSGCARYDVLRVNAGPATARAGAARHFNRCRSANSGEPPVTSVLSYQLNSERPRCARSLISRDARRRADF